MAVVGGAGHSVMRNAVSIRTALAFLLVVVVVGAAAPAAFAVPPTANAGGPYTIAEGDGLTLDGSASYDFDGDPITSYQWDINYNGTWTQVTGVSPTVSWAQLQSYGVDDNGGYSVRLRVTAGGETDYSSRTMTVNNTPPTLAVTGAATIAEGQSYTLDLSAADPGADAITSWTVNWGDGAVETIAGSPPQVTHDYVRAGYTYDIVVAATDEDGTWHDNDLLVGSETLDRIFRFAPTTGNYVQQFGAGTGLDLTRGLDIGPDGRLYVCGHNSHNVLRYDADTGAFVDQFVAAGSGGLDFPVGLTFGPDGNLYVAAHGSDRIIRYDGSTGAYLDDFVSSGSGGLNDPAGIKFGPDGRLYVASEQSHSILRYDGISGAFLDEFVPAGSGGLNMPYDLTFGPDGNLYVTSHGSDTVIRYDGASGALIGVFAWESGMAEGAGLAFGPDGHLYVSVWYDDNVVRFNGTTGAQIDNYVGFGSGGLDAPVFIRFAPSQFVTVVRGSAPTVAAAIPDTTVMEDAGTLAAYRDLDLVFDDVEDGDALEYTIVSNSNPSLLTATIDAGNALDLAIAPDSSGSATVAVRAADRSAQYALETFVIDVSPVADDPVAMDDPGQYSTLVRAMNPVGYWRLGEGAGPVAADSGSAANDGSYSAVGLGEPGAITGDANTAVRFNGSTSYIEIPHDDAYLLDDGSVQFWFNFASNPFDREAIFSKDASGYVTGGHLSAWLQTSGSLQVRLQSASGDHYVNSPSLSTGTWHHAVFTFGSRGMELYVDGVAEDGNPYTGGLGTTSGGAGNHEPAAIGANTWISNTGSIFPLSQHFDGVVDEVAIFGKQLTASEVRALFRAGGDGYRTDEEVPLLVSAADGVLVNDFDGDGDPLTAVHTGGPGNAQSFTLNPDGSFSYTPATDFFGTDTFTYVADDGGAVSDTATVTIFVTGVNDAPRVVAALPDTVVARDAAPIDDYRDLGDVFADDEDGRALSFTIESNDNPALLTATIDADSALDLAFTPGLAGFAEVVVRATDTGALFVLDTMNVYVSAGVDAWNARVGNAVVNPGGPPRSMASLYVSNASALPETLSAVAFGNATSGPGVQDDLDAAFAQMTLSAPGGSLLPGGSPGPAAATFSSGVLRFSGLEAPITPGDTLRLVVSGAASLTARDGDVLGIAPLDSSGLEFTWELPVNGAFPAAPADSFTVDGMTAAQVAVHPVSAGTLPSGSSNRLALDVTLPANGYEPDTLERLNVVNNGTAADTVDVVGMRAWTDDGDGLFDPMQDTRLGSFSWTGARWELTGVAQSVPVGGARLFITVDIADNPQEGTTVNLALPALPDVGVGMASGNDGPIDVTVENPFVQTISTADRIVLSAAPVAGGTVHPGDGGVVVLALVATNNYTSPKTMTRLSVTNATVPAGAAAPDELDAEFDNLQLREDANDNGVLDAADPLVGTGVFTSGTAVFAGLEWDLPPGAGRYLFLTADVPLAHARDGDALDVEVSGAYNAAFSDATTVIAAWPVNSPGQNDVDGMVAAQLFRHDIASATLSPGDGPVLALDVVLPCNGYAADVLNSLTVENRGTAQSADIAELRAWRDGGDDAFDAGAGDDADIGQLVWTGSSWASIALNEPLAVGGTRVYFAITVAGAVTDSATVRLAIPTGGVSVSSDNDGPIDVAVESAQTLLLSTAPLLASLDVDPTVSTLGQNVTVRMMVENVGGEQINNVAPTPLAPTGAAAFTVLTGPQPASVDLAVGAVDTFTWVLASTSAGDATWRSTAQGTGFPSGLQRSSLEASSDLHRVFDQAIGVEMYPIESMPFLISRGQTGVVPLSLTFTAPGGAGVSQARVRSLRIRLEDDQGTGIVPTSLLSRVVVSEGNTVYRDKTALESTGSEVDLTLSTPAVIPTQEPVTLSLRLDVLATTVVPEFRVTIPDSAWIGADDAISGAPVTVTLQEASWPVESGLGRVTARPTQLDVDALASAGITVGWGQSDVEMTTLRLTNPGVAGVTSDVAAASVCVGLVDDAGAPVPSPAQVIERLRARGPLGTFYADIPVTAADSTRIDVRLSPLLEINASVPVDVTFLADIVDGAATGAYRLDVLDPSRFDARDANTGESLAVMFAADPLQGRVVTVEAPAETVLVSGTAAFPSTVLVGEGGVHAMTLHLRHPAPAGTGRIRVDAVEFRCQNEARNPLVPASYLAGVAAVRDSVQVGSVSSLPTSGDRVTLPLSGVLLQPGESVDVEVLVDVSATAPMSFFEMTVEAAGGIDAVDANTGSAGRGRRHDFSHQHGGGGFR
jgi:WD40 repeat protein